MKLKIYQTADVEGIIKMEWTLIPITARVEKILQCLCCYKLDHHKAHECPKRLEIKICSICAGKGKNCEHGNNINKHK